MTQHNLSGWSIFNSHWWQERERPTKNIGSKVQLEEQASFTCPFIGSCSFPPPNGDRDKGLHLFHCRLGGRWFLSDQGDHCLLGFTMICHTRWSSLIFSILNLCLPLANAGHSGTFSYTQYISIFNVDFLCSYMYVSEETPLHRWLYEDNERLQCDGPVALPCLSRSHGREGSQLPRQHCVR